MSEPRPRHPALAARILTVGVSTAAALGLVALLARDSKQEEPTGTQRLVEVRLGDDVDDDEARAAVRAWLDGNPDLTTDGGLTVVELPADTVSEPS